MGKRTWMAIIVSVALLGGFFPCPDMGEVHAEELSSDEIYRVPGWRDAYIEGVVPLNQKPELPTGCEVTTLTMALNFAGYEADKLMLASDYLPKAAMGADSNPYTTFIGTPTSVHSFGCYAPAIVTCALRYGAFAADISYCEFDELFDYVRMGRPVIVWGTMNMIPTTMGTYTYTRPDGVVENWKNHEHCLLLVGYDLDANTVALADPLKGGIVRYDLAVFHTRWNEQGNQAVIIYERDVWGGVYGTVY